MAHIGKNNIGQKPTYPRGKRRIDNELAKFLTKRYGFIFNDSDFVCTCCLDLAKESFGYASPAVASSTMDLEELLPVRAAESAALSNISRMSSGAMSLFDSEDSSSDILDEAIMDFNSQLNRKNSIELLNNVLSIVDLSPVRDIKKRSFVREQVNIALSFIRQTAEQIYKGEEKEEEYLIDDQPNISMNEAMELVNSFKLLVDRSDHSEKIKLITYISSSNLGQN